MAESRPHVGDLAKQEEKILEFWNKNHIFEKSVEKDAPRGEYVFYDGPPFATGLPHYGSLLSSVIKDVIPRYKTMQGYRVRRRWGWDCHGLPIENMVEKELGLKTKKDILKFGVGKFNTACRDSVLRYAKDWEKYINRIGRWVEFKHAYQTMDNTYIESVWWALKEIYKKRLLYQGRKVLMYCTRCETPLAKAEIAMDQSYQEITEEAVTVKFKAIDPHKYGLPKKLYLLAWTTTPWTLPGNAALAVNQMLTYVLVLQDGTYFVLAKDALKASPLSDAHVERELKGSDLIGLRYEPLYKTEKIKRNDEHVYRIAHADFVTTEEGAGIVHIAPMYGEDDYQFGLMHDLPMVPMLGESGHFSVHAPEFISGKFYKSAEPLIKEDLKKRDLLFAQNSHAHSYPHCHRCGTPLIYNAVVSWFINIQKVKSRMLALNEKINWVPSHLKHGRFGNIVKDAPDWTISRNRFWAAPMPIWRHPKTGEPVVIGSIAELKKHTKTSGNRYFLMRHGMAESNKNNVVSSNPKSKNHLTEKGRKQVLEVAQVLYKNKIDRVFVSPLLRTKETAEIIKDKLQLSEDIFTVDDRLQETNFGKYDNHSRDEYWEYFSSPMERFDKAPPGGETILDVKRRAGSFLYELEEKYIGETILIVTHEDVLWMLSAVTLGANKQGCLKLKSSTDDVFKNAEVRELPFVPLPHNKEYELDLHRPYIDDIVLCTSDGTELVRTPEVIDGWVESGAMPFAGQHYPFENLEIFDPQGGWFKKPKGYPSDFIAEYIGQTRTWFYYMHVLGTLLFDRQSFNNVVTTGNILAKDGTKMSKSKGNYIDPLENINRFGADALRFLLMSSVVMQAEDFKFTDGELKEVHNRVINILWNTYKFYSLYKGDYDESVQPSKSKNVLDRWVLARLGQTIEGITKHLEVYDMVHATRLMKDFIVDFSTWYIRRSRDRFRQEGDIVDQRVALATTHHVLIEFSKAIAPVLPFISESIYQGVGGKKQSVHLEEWPVASGFNEEIIKDMKEVRYLVSLVLEKRAEAGIKVRQPLRALAIKHSVLEGKLEFLELIKEEVNVKEISFDPIIEDAVMLDTVLTPELKEEGLLRELIHQIQALRKKKKLIPADRVALVVYTDESGKAFIRKHEKKILSSAKLLSIHFTDTPNERLPIGELAFALAFE